MKVVILAGGLGTRISEESHLRPKPMIEIGGMPILWHIMKLYSYYGFNEFIICAGYKQEIIKKWFADYYLHTSDVTFDFTLGNKVVVHNEKAEPWKVTVVDTGLNTMTGGRIRCIKRYLNDEPFFLTYGDGVSNVNIVKELEFHKLHGKLVTMSAYNAEQRFGVMDISADGIVQEFREKTKGDGNLINMGFMICEPQFIDYISGDDIFLEKEPLEHAAKDKQLVAYRHDGFFQCMDTKREMEHLEQMWTLGKAPWKIWD